MNQPLTKLPRREDKPGVYLSPKATRRDVEACDLGRCGFTMKSIAEATGLTENQVAYRLRSAGISTKDYRNMQNDLARQVAKVVHDNSDRYFDMIVSNVKRYLKD